MSPRFAHITGWGMAVPDKVLTNDDLVKMVDTNDDWIISRTGVRERRIAGSDQSTASLASDAAMRALEVANVHPGDLDMIILSTSTPEYIFPATACLVQDQIGAGKAGAFDLLAACTGFLYALNLGSQAIKSNGAENILIIGSETLSRVVNWKDRNTCILFGDGAGAFVLQASDEPGGILSAVLRSDGSGGDLLSVPGGGSRHPASMQTLYDGLHYIQMNGRGVFRFATRVMAEATQQTVESAQLTMDDIQLLIPHQANQRIIEAAARRLDYPMEQVMVNVDRYGNTSTASIPIATVEALEQGRLKPGDNTVMVAFGSGLTWGAVLVQWSGPIPFQRKVSPRKVRWFARTRSLLARLRRRIEGLLWGSE
ncbi:MAG: ketoacyl-ACP synthase III [Chloroflexi bacterium]|nr:ketoacyl-ACP synthase III [Chloroflexota bacterium]